MTRAPGRRGRRWLIIVALLVLGVVLGAAGAFVQAHRAVVETPWGALVVPWGVPLVWLALVSAVRGGAWVVRSRWGGWAVVVGWICATIALAAETPSGDLALSGGGRQMTYLLGGVIVMSAAASLPVPRQDAAPGSRRGAPTDSPSDGQPDSPSDGQPDGQPNGQPDGQRNGDVSRTV